MTPLDARSASSPCAICANPEMRPFRAFDFGVWRLEDGEEARREDYRYDLLSCDVCGHVMVDLAGVAARHGADFVARLYDLPQTAERWSLEDLPPDAPYAEMVDFAGAEGIPDQGPIVDFGCGQGHVLTVLRDRHRVAVERLLGVDYAPPDIGVPVLRSDLARLEATGPLPCDGFRMAYCAHTLEHLPDPGGLLRALRRRAASGAHLYLEVPDHGPVDPAVDEAANLRNAQHLHYFHLGTLERLAVGRGWTVVRRDASLFGIVPRARLLLRADPVEVVRAATERAESRLDRVWREAATRVAAEAVDGAALWGLGGDLFRMMAASPELVAAMAAGRFVLVDSGLAGRRFMGQPVVGAEAVVVGAGPVVVTPRPAKIRRAIMAAGTELGIDGRRWRDPYPAAG